MPVTSIVEDFCNKLEQLRPFVQQASAYGLPIPKNLSEWSRGKIHLENSSELGILFRKAERHSRPCEARER